MASILLAVSAERREGERDGARSCPWPSASASPASRRTPATSTSAPGTAAPRAPRSRRAARSAANPPINAASTAPTPPGVGAADASVPPIIVTTVTVTNDVSPPNASMLAHRASAAPRVVAPQPSTISASRFGSRASSTRSRDHLVQAWTDGGGQPSTGLRHEHERADHPERRTRQQVQDRRSRARSATGWPTRPPPY